MREGDEAGEGPPDDDEIGYGGGLAGYAGGYNGHKDDSIWEDEPPEQESPDPESE